MRIFILGLFFLITSLYGSNIKTKNILVIHTYDYQYPWTRSLFRGMDIAQKESSTAIKFYTEQIDFKKIKLDEKEKWKNYFVNKYNNIPLDGIIVVFGNAIKFINEYGDTIFKDVPKIIYGNGTNNNDLDTIIMKIENSFAVEKTVKAALSQNKDVQNIYLLGNAAELTKQLKKLTKKYIKKYSSFKPINIPSLSAAETDAYLSKIPKNSIVFYCLYFEDKEGIKLSPAKYLERFSAVSTAPIYSYYSVLVGIGTIGGEVIDSSLLMQNMVKILLLENKDITNSTFSIKSLYDYNILKKFDIDMKGISQDAIINKPINYLKIYKEDILILLSILLLIMFIISIYVSKKRKEKLLEELEMKNKLLHLKEEFNKFFELPINLQLIINIENGEITQINNASKLMLGYEPKELFNSKFIKLVHPQDSDSTLNLIKKIDKERIVYFFENRLKHKSGDYINLAWSATTDMENKLMYATAQNITKYKLIEKEKKEKEKLLNQQSKMATMGEMIGNIAHQWKQPLSVISMSNSLLKMSREETELFTQKEITDALYSIDDSIEHLSETIDDFRNFFKPDKEKSYFKLVEVHDKMYKLIKPQFKNNNIELIQNLDDVELYGFPNEILQVLINIIKNAKDELIKDTSQKRRLIFIESQKEKNEIIIRIRDNAGGISDDIINDIFKPYFSTKSEDEGTGIGLYMCKQIIENMEGSIQAYNVQFDYEEIEYFGAEFKIKLNI